MPSRNIVKSYVAGGFYHVYNRGVAKQPIFIDDQDYRMMIHCIRRHLSAELFCDKVGRPYKKLYKQMEIHAYCLMPTHFHFLVKQNTTDGMEQLLRRVMTSYSLYFNWRHDRVGTLFQGTYKARMVEGDSDLIGVSRYIHENPKEIWGGKNMAKYPYSSLSNYFSRNSTDWLTITDLLGLTDGPLGYLDLLHELQGFSLQGETL